MKYKYLILLIFFITPLAPAADSLGRLFLTPDQRAQLEVTRARRDQRQPATAEPAPVAAAAPQPQGPETVTYSGLVRRSDGKSTVWINGNPVDERSRTRGAGDVNVLGMQADGAVSVAIPQASRTASLRVGQRLDVRSGRIEEAYGRRIAARTLARSPPSTIAPTETSKSPQSLRERYFREGDREYSTISAEQSQK